MNCRPFAWPSPVFLSVTVKPICSPAFTASASAVFSTSIAAQLTSIDAPAWSEPSFVVVTVAVLSSWPQSVASVVATTCTVVEAPAFSVVGVYTRLPFAIDQPAEAGEIDQLRPAGRTSVNCRPFAWPSPVFLSVTVKPTCSPALDARRVGRLLDVDRGAVDVDGGGVAAAAGAGRGRPSRCCSTIPQVAAVVGLTTCTDLLAPGAIVPKLQVSVPAAIAQAASSGDSVQLRPAVGRQRVADGDAVGVALAGVGDLDREADLVAGAHGGGVGGLVDHHGAGLVVAEVLAGHVRRRRAVDAGVGAREVAAGARGLRRRADPAARAAAARRELLPERVGAARILDVRDRVVAARVGVGERLAGVADAVVVVVGPDAEAGEPGLTRVLDAVLVEVVVLRAGGGAVADQQRPRRDVVVEVGGVRGRRPRVHPDRAEREARRAERVVEQRRQVQRTPRRRAWPGSGCPATRSSTAGSSWIGAALTRALDVDVVGEGREVARACRSARSRSPHPRSSSSTSAGSRPGCCPETW